MNTKEFKPYSLTNIIEVLLGYVGIVWRRFTWKRAVSITLCYALFYLLLEYPHKIIALIYFTVSSIGYFLFLMFCFKKNGIRDYLIANYGTDKGYCIYEAILSCAFFLPGASLVYLNLCFSNDPFFNYFSQPFKDITYQVFFWVGLVSKLWSAVLVSVDIYYYRDMFLEKKIVPFQTRGIYRLFKNPMYGIGHLHAYSIAISYSSLFGLVAAAFNQIAIFVFYFVHEKPFIKQLYQNKPLKN